MQRRSGRLGRLPRSAAFAAGGAPLAAGCLGGQGSPAPSPAPSPVPPEPYVPVPGGPLAITSPHDGTGRLFVATKAGLVRVVRDGVPDPDPMLDIASLVSTGGEQGLLGIPVHPGFPDDPRVVVDYTDVNGDTVVASYRLDPADPDRLDPGSATTILAVAHPFANPHGGGGA